MDISVEYNADKGICCVRGTGTLVDRNDAKRFAEALMVTGRPQGCSRFLIDLRETRILSTILDTFQTAAAWNEGGFNLSDRVAIVFAQDESKHAFLATVARNRGFSTSIFNDMEAAIAWLSGVATPDKSGERDS